MLGKFFLFGLLWWLLGNPFLAIVVLLVVLYLLERRFVGLTPSLIRPMRRLGELSRWRKQLQLNPHDVSAKMEIARLSIERKKYAEALKLLNGIEAQMEHSAEYWSNRGLCELALGRLEAGEKDMLRALDISPRVKYGLPLLRLGEAYAKLDPGKALGYLQRFAELHSSSCEGYYRLGMLYRRMGKTEEARRAFRDCAQVFRTLPRYMRRHERKWALLAMWRGRR